MVNSKNGNGNDNGNGKNKVVVSFFLDSEMNKRLEKYAEVQDKSVNSVIIKSIEHHLDSRDAKAVLKKACDDGRLREGSRACKSKD